LKQNEPKVQEDFKEIFGISSQNRC